MENGPHDLGVVHSTIVVPDIEAENDFIELRLLYSDALVAKWRRQLSQEVRQPNGSHIELAHRVILGPGVLESLDILFFECQDVVLVLGLLVVVKTLADDGNEDIHEDKEGDELEGCPEEDSYEAFAFIAVVHDAVP